jgi:hypothetical protein
MLQKLVGIPFNSHSEYVCSNERRFNCVSFYVICKRYSHTYRMFLCVVTEDNETKCKYVASKYVKLITVLVSLINSLIIFTQRSPNVK